MIITNVGRPVNRFPLFRLKDGEGTYLLVLSRVDVSDVGNETNAEAFYTPLVHINFEDQMTTVEFRVGKNVLVVFISPKRIDWHVERPDQETEQ